MSDEKINGVRARYGRTQHVNVSVDINCDSTAHVKHKKQTRLLDTDRRSPTQLGGYAMKQHDTTRHVQFRTTDTGKRGTTLMSWSRPRQRRGGSLLSIQCATWKMSLMMVPFSLCGWRSQP